MSTIAAKTFWVEGLDELGSGKPLSINGIVDEHADLSFIGELRGKVQLNLKHLRRINSYGVRMWIDAVRQVPADTKLEFVECSPAVVDQINMVAGFLGHGKVLSFFAPMRCDKCMREEDQLFFYDDCLKRGGKLPEVKCDKCLVPMEIDDVEEQYLLFLREDL